MAQGPGDGHFTGRAAVARADLAKTFDELEIFRQAWLAKFRIAAAKIIGRQGGGALASHGPSEQTGGHRCIGDHADGLLFAIRESLSFNLAADDGVGWLQRSDHSTLFGSLDLGHIEI